MNIQKLKPHERQFFKDNEHAINQLQKIAEDALELAKEINVRLFKYDEYYAGGIKKCLEEGENAEYLKVLYPEIIDALKNTNHRLDLPSLKKLDNPLCSRNIKVNVFGMLKTGDLSVGSLKDDIADHSEYNQELNTTYFDLDSMIGVGLDIWPMEKGVNHDCECSGYNGEYFVVDVNALLVRMIQTGYTLKADGDSNRVIIDTIVNRLFKLAMVKDGLNKMLMEYCGDNCYFTKDKPQIVKIDPRYSLDNIIKSLIVYKVWYNIVNGLCDKEFEDAVDEIMDKWKVAATMFNTKVATNDLYREMYNKIVCGLEDRLRYPDAYLESAKGMYNKAANWYVRGHHGFARPVDKVTKGTAFVVGVESETAEFIYSSLGMNADLYNKKYKNNKAINCLLGMESADMSKFKNFNDYKKFTRAQVLTKLNTKDRALFIKTENEIIRLRATATNLKDEFGQQNCLKKASTLGKLIQLDISKAQSENNDAMVELLTLLDTDRLDIMDDIANRNIVKERKTQLYGMVNKTANWDY